MRCPDCGKDNIPGEDACGGCGHDLPTTPARLPTGELAMRMRKGKVLDIEPRPAVSVKPEDSLAHAVELMRD